MQGTQPHAPYNVSGIAIDTSITITWMPGYSGGPDYKQDYTLWYREAGISDWSTIQVSPSGSTSVTINGLSPGKTYEFQVVGKNALGDGMMSKLITIRTIGKFDDTFKVCLYCFQKREKKKIICYLMKSQKLTHFF